MIHSEIKSIAKNIGNSFYIFKNKELVNNITEFRDAFSRYYSNINIGYSVKTNYIPYACKIAYEQGTYIEVVSEMELQIALKIGVPTNRIIYNGPIKNIDSLEYCLLNNVKINIDNYEEMTDVAEIASRHYDFIFKIGIRINIRLDDGFESRFGFDTDSEDFHKTLELIKSLTNVEVTGLHTHSTRPDKSIGCYVEKLNQLVFVYKKYFSDISLAYIDLGGGFYGKMDENIKRQFPNENIVSFIEYGEYIGRKMKEYFPEEKPELILEPGLAMTVNMLDFVCEVINTRNIQGKNIATTTGSFHNIKPSGHKKNLTVERISLYPEVSLISDIAGYTCLENDVIYHDYPFQLYCGDFLRFRNVGAYTLVFKPVFIKLAPPIICLTNGSYIIIKEEDNFEDLFKSYKFD